MHTLELEALSTQLPTKQSNLINFLYQRGYSHG